MFGNPMEIAIIAGAAILLFGGGNKIRDLARGLGQAKQEFARGQADSDVEAERIRDEARARAEAARAQSAVDSGPAVSTGAGVEVPRPVPGSGTTPVGSPSAADVTD